MNLPQGPHLPKVPVTVNEPSRRASLLLAVGSIDDYGRSNHRGNAPSGDAVDHAVAIVQKASDLGVSVLAITDHNHVGGIASPRSVPVQVV